jgi:hypothetical protein
VGAALAAIPYLLVHPGNAAQVAVSAIERRYDFRMIVPNASELAEVRP